MATKRTTKRVQGSMASETRRERRQEYRKQRNEQAVEARRERAKEQRAERQRELRTDPGMHKRSILNMVFNGKRVGDMTGAEVRALAKKEWAKAKLAEQRAIRLHDAARSPSCGANLARLSGTS